MKIIIITFLLVLASPFSYSKQISDANFADTLSASSDMPELALNGASLRELYLLIETYAGALYLENTSQDASEIIESIQHKKMVFHVLMKKVSARRLSNALEEALVLNISKAQYAQVQPAVEQMLSYFTGNLLKGETVEFNFIPGKGTDVIIGDALQGRIKGKEFFDSMLKVWIGEYPVTREFKNQVLGASSF